jgi:DNA polymerase (family 10)
VAGLFRQAALYMELLGRDPQRVRTWGRIASVLEAQVESVTRLLAEGRLGDIRGIGPTTVAAVRDLVKTGRLEMLEDLRREVPPGLLPLLSLPGLGVSRVRRLWLALGVLSTSDLELACRTNRLRDLDGFGSALQQRVLGALVRGETWGRRRLLDVARRAASRVLDRLQREPAALRLAVAGALRRMEPIIERVDLVATAHDTAGLLDAFETMPFVDVAVARGDRDAVVRLDDGVEVWLEVAAREADYAVLLFRRTGPDTHVEALAQRAAACGCTLLDDRLARGGRRVDVAEEEALYAALDLPFVPPERRGATGLDGGEALVTMRDVQGCVGLHTVDGAGAFELEDMATRAEREGYRWAVVTDRSHRAFPRGASLEAVRAQAERIARYREQDPDGIELFHGTEVDVLPDGRLDWPDDVLRAFDFVVAAVNDGHGPDGRPQDEAAMTERVCRAVAHPQVHALAHPEGRVLLGRPGWPVNVEAVLRACADAGTAVSVSGLPHRLDLDERWHAYARLLGLRALPAADAHDLNGIDQAILAVGALRRGGWRPGEVLTTLSAAAFKASCDDEAAGGR